MFRRIFFLILIGHFVFGTTIIDMVENKTISIDTFMHIKSLKVNLTTIIAFPGSLNQNKLATCKALNKSEFGPNFRFPPGSGIVVFAYEGCSNKVHAKLVQDAGGSVAFIASGTPFLDSTYKFGIEELKIPVVFIRIREAIVLLRTIGKNSARGYPTRIINFTANPNEWATLGKGGFWIFLETVLLLTYLFNFIVGIRSLILHFKKEGLRLSISQTTVWINLISTLFWSMIVFDPWNVRYISKQEFIQIMNCIATPSLLTSVLFLSFFFNEVLIARGFIKPQLTTLKYPFLIINLLFWACYIANAYYFGSYQTNFTVYKLIVFMGIVFFGLAGIYFLVMSILILARLKTYNSPVIKRLIPLITIVSFGVMLLVSGSIIQAVLLYNYFNEKSLHASWSLIFSSSAFILTPQFVYFREPYTSQTSSIPKQTSEKKESKVIYEKQHSSNNFVDV